MIIIIIFTVIIIICASVAPVIEIIFEKLKPKKERDYYIFSQELFDAEYNDKSSKKDCFEKRFKVDNFRYWRRKTVLFLLEWYSFLNKIMQK